MLNEPLTSTTALRWTQTGAGGTLTIGNATLTSANWSAAIPTFDIEQLNLGLNLISTAGSTYVMQLRGSHDGTTWYTITVRGTPTVSGAAQRYLPYAYELGPVGAGPTFIDEARPWAWHYLSIGFYNPAGAPAVGDQVNVVVERQRGGQLQAGV